MKKITIDELAIMVQKGFNEVYHRMDKRFDEVDKRFEEVDQRFEEIDRKFEKMEQRMTDMEERMTNKWVGRVERLEDDMRVVKTKLKLR